MSRDAFFPLEKLTKSEAVSYQVAYLSSVLSKILSQVDMYLATTIVYSTKPDMTHALSRSRVLDDIQAGPPGIPVLKTQNFPPPKKKFPKIPVR